MLFHYLAQDKKGKLKEGHISQPNLKAVLDYLTSQNLKPLAVKPITFEETFTKKGIFVRREKISLTEKVFLIKYLALMLRIGTDLFSAIDILIEFFESGPVRRFLLEIRTYLEQGKPFSLAFEKHTEIFSPIITNLIKAGEASGTLEVTLNQIANDLERERNLSSKVKSALIYPAVLVVASFLMIIFLVTFAIPRLGEMFLSTGQPIPFYTRLVLTTGMFLNKYLYVFLPLFLGIPLGLYFYFTQTKEGKKYFSDMLLKLPVVKNLMEKMALFRLTSVLSNLIKSGVPIIKATEVTAMAVGHPQYEEALRRISKEYITQGLTLGESFRREKVFPSILTNLISISEKAGRSEEVLSYLADFYEGEIDVSLKTLTSLIEPMLLLGLGLIIGGIALSLIVPVYQMVSQF
ncbi:MAG: type II secretion system F family protein [Candidatus Paceibacterota bacterium]